MRGEMIMICPGWGGVQRQTETNMGGAKNSTVIQQVFLICYYAPDIFIAGVPQ